MGLTLKAYVLVIFEESDIRMGVLAVVNGPWSGTGMAEVHQLPESLIGVAV